MKTLTIILSGLTALSMSACAVTTAGVKKGDERNFARSIDDVSAGRVISARMSRAYDYELGKVDVEVAEGIAVLTGSVPRQEDKVEAERIAWSAPNVVMVGNEIALNNSAGLIRDSKDAYISTAIRTRLIAEKNVKARNVNIETENGIVYLLGVARDQAELERMAYIAGTTDGVKEVISYVKINGQAVTTQAGFSSAPSHSTAPGYLSPNIPSAPSTTASPYGSVPMLQTPGEQTAQRELPGFLSSTPQPSGEAEPFFRDPNTGERIVLPPGTKTVPFDPNKLDLGAPKVGDAPYYINPSNGEKIQIVWTGG